jgi:methylenetetrahydrofolate reductase (NADPH)
MPTTNFKGVQRMAEKCGTRIPDWLISEYIGLEEDLERRQEIAINVVVDQCRGLISEGFDRLHFYTLNQYKVISEACHILGLGVESRLAEEELTGSSNRETS